ncbi:SCP-like extracellular protein [Sclerotinia borealis F-4128]|uniref:SCP-like extracellular protein n=1 Tax=Sclerotinia borealis (strain F-4128) TaxID=1432307 RepID=W9CRY6_SCLBF|nr:SCP-like extracellular protein [Sclerotinia borealis F-4128]
MHNDARRYALGVQRPPLIWDTKLEAAAERHANILAGRGGTLQHDSHDARNCNQGENIYWEARNVSEAEMYHSAISYWTSENSLYQGQPISREDLRRWGHYTQIIWPSTTRVGMASAKTKSGATYIVARYMERGNIFGQSAYEMSYKTGSFPAASSSGVAIQWPGISTLSPSRPYEKCREDPTIAQHYPSYQPTRKYPGTSIRLRSHENVSDLRSYQPTTGIGDVFAEARTGLSRARTYQPVTGNKIQDLQATLGQYHVPPPVDRPEITNRVRVRDIKNFFKEIEEPISRLSPRKLFGKERTS